jgi:peptide/nickel transport system substrate-binding protein
MKKWRLGLILALVLGIALLTACTQEPAPPTEEEAAPEEAAPAEEEEAAPAEEEEAATAEEEAEMRCVRVANSDNSGPAQTNDPAFHVTTDDGFRIHNIYDRFIDIDNNLDPVPNLAESWEPNEDATEWLFYLREGVMFSDGTPLTAADVVYTYQRLIDPDVGSPSASTLTFLEGATIEAVDDLTVRFAFDEPVVELPIMLTGYSTYVIPENADPEVLRLQGIGTGPFMIDEFEPNTTYARLVPNPYYWGEPPQVDCIEQIIIEEPTTRISALLAGEVDIMVQLDIGQIPMIEDDPNIVIAQVPGATSYGMPMWVDTPPFDNIHLRNALKLAADRQELVDIVLLGYGVPGIDSPLPPTSPYAHVSEAPAQDIPGCMEELALAGYPDGVDLTLYTSEVLPGFVELAQAYAEQAAECGIRIEVVQAPAETYWDEVWMQEPWLVSGWSALPVYQALTVATLSTSEWNDTHFYREDFDALIEQASQTIDDDERRALYQDASRMIAEEGGFLTTIFVPVLSAYRSNIEGFEPHIIQSTIDMRGVHFTD